ncbi:peptidase M41-like protein [Kribbella orskensis]|uniref:Peptidase M41-like protein n=1 Tax=Kribbella orskensis TaxID=2512216 RepID=A0ABY2BM67_9ACTN|nr:MULTISPECIES: hypothetical protein [Kribbella]TCN41647.1 peptidase M41-like protein [Kribbella sp. VKM Ac-2500]TCO25525.1 peptidase M41-like protein [Kribbella orskensis]
MTLSQTHLAQRGRATIIKHSSTPRRFLLPRHSVEQVGHSQLKSDIAAGQVSSVAIGPDGNVSGKLSSGTSSTSSCPVGLQDPQFIQLLAIRLGGRAAERVALGEISTGASNDLAGATALATRMVREFGMSTTLGPVGFSSANPTYLGDQEFGNRPYAEATQLVIDEEVAKLLREAEQRATTALTDHRDQLDRLSAFVLER